MADKKEPLNDAQAKFAEIVKIGSRPLTEFLAHKKYIQKESVLADVRGYCCSDCYAENVHVYQR